MAGPENAGAACVDEEEEKRRDASHPRKRAVAYQARRRTARALP